MPRGGLCPGHPRRRTSSARVSTPGNVLLLTSVFRHRFSSSNGNAMRYQKLLDAYLLSIESGKQRQGFA